MFTDNHGSDKKMNEDQQEPVVSTKTSSAPEVSTTIPLPAVAPDIPNSRGEATEEDDAFSGINANILELKDIVDVFHQTRVKGSEREALRHYVAQNIRPERLISAQIQAERYDYRPIREALENGLVNCMQSSMVHSKKTTKSKTL